MIIDPGQHFGQPRLGIDIIHPWCLDQRIHHRRSFTAAIRSASWKMLLEKTIDMALVEIGEAKMIAGRPVGEMRNASDVGLGRLQLITAINKVANVDVSDRFESRVAEPVSYPACQQKMSGFVHDDSPLQR